MFTKLLLICLGLVVPSLGATLPYIIGGTTVSDATKYPHQCSLRRYGSHSCGASVISSTWLVTAAHCISGTTSYSVRCGSVNRNSGGVVRNIVQVIQHEDYGKGAGSYPNDIALMKVAAMPLSSTIKAISMATTDPAGNNDCYITGWGYTTTGGGGIIPTYLQQAKINVYTPSECKAKWGSSRINAGHICIGDSTNGRGSCNGDSGGPLVCRIGGSYKLVGATSWGVSGCRTSYPSVYSRISYFRQWIKDNSGI